LVKNNIYPTEPESTGSFFLEQLIVYMKYIILPEMKQNSIERAKIVRYVKAAPRV
jgi:hypothetical protein